MPGVSFNVGKSVGVVVGYGGEIENYPELTIVNQDNNSKELPFTLWGRGEAIKILVKHYLEGNLINVTVNELTPSWQNEGYNVFNLTFALDIGESYRVNLLNYQEINRIIAGQVNGVVTTAPIQLVGRISWLETLEGVSLGVIDTATLNGHPTLQLYVTHTGEVLFQRWDIGVTGQSNNSGVIVFLATQDCQIDSLGDVIINSVIRSTEIGLRRHDVTFACPADGSGILRVLDAQLITILGGASISFRPTTSNPTDAPITSFKSYLLPRLLQRVIQSDSARAALFALSGNVADLPKNITDMTWPVNNTLDGDLANLPSELYNISLMGANTCVNYTAGRQWSNSMRNFIRSSTITNPILSVTAQRDLLIDLSQSNWTVSRIINFNYTSSAVMADTSQGGIWGDFSNPDNPTPSNLAIACKNLVRSKSVTVNLRGVTWPGDSGDGVGLPANFGNWWRS